MKGQEAHGRTNYCEVAAAEVELAKGATVPQAARKLGVTEQTYYRRRKECGGIRTDQGNVETGQREDTTARLDRAFDSLGAWFARKELDSPLLPRDRSAGRTCCSDIVRRA